MSEGIKINATFDAARIGNVIDRLAIASHKALGETLRQQGKLAAAEFVNIMPPMLSLDGKDPYNQQRKLGMAAVNSDVRSAYTTVDDVYDDLKQKHPGDLAEGFWKKVKQGKLEAAQILVRKYADPKFASAELGPFTREVYDRWRSPHTGRISIKKYFRAIVTNPRELTAFIKLLQQRVGILKAGSFAAAWQAGIAINVPQWISNHHGSGTGEAHYEGSKPFLRLSNTTPYADHHNAGNRLLEAVLGNRTRAMERMLESESFQRWSAAARMAA